LIEAGSETTSATLNNGLYLMLSNPDCIRQAHEEIDRVVGQDRTPSFDDEPDLPFTRGIIKETLRMRPINKFGNNHCNTEDDWYNGYFIPKGTIVMANWWYIHYDAKYYPEPETFLPERWLDYPHSAARAAALPDGTQRDHLTYGGGRRICAGIHLAEKSLFINVARILWGFDIELAKDEKDRSIELDFSTKSLQKGSSSVTRPFPCQITPRSQRHEQIMREEWRTAQEKGLDFSHIKWTV
jgi:cytochrome P450